MFYIVSSLTPAVYSLSHKMLSILVPRMPEIDLMPKIFKAAQRIKNGHILCFSPLKMAENSHTSQMSHMKTLPVRKGSIKIPISGAYKILQWHFSDPRLV